MNEHSKANSTFNDAIGLSWSLFEKTGELKYYMLYRDLVYGDDNDERE